MSGNSTFSVVLICELLSWTRQGFRRVSGTMHAWTVAGPATGRCRGQSVAGLG